MKIPNFLDLEEQARLVRELEQSNSLSALRNLIMVKLLLNAGLRAGEVRGLMTTNLNLAAGRLKVLGKRKKERIVWLNQDDVRLLQEWLRRRRPTSSNLVFTTLDGRRPVNDRWLRDMVRRMSKRAGIVKNIHPHSLRHTFATDLLRQTKNLRLVQKALGHSNIQTTTIYAHIVDDELENAMKELRK